MTRNSSGLRPYQVDMLNEMRAMGSGRVVAVICTPRRIGLKHAMAIMEAKVAMAACVQSMEDLAEVARREFGGVTIAFDEIHHFDDPKQRQADLGPNHDGWYQMFNKRDRFPRKGGE